MCHAGGTGWGWSGPTPERPEVGSYGATVGRPGRTGSPPPDRNLVLHRVRLCRPVAEPDEPTRGGGDESSSASCPFRVCNADGHAEDAW